jgi:AcrR family transcriptional regulator
MAAQRDRILEAALKCFADTGFHQTSTDHIARAAGCGKSAIYAHFESKRDIIEALSERESQHYGSDAVRDLAQFEEYVANALDALETPRMRQYSRLTFHMAAEGLSDPDYLAWQDRLAKRYLAWVEPLVRKDPAASGLSERQVNDASRRLMCFWAGQAMYKMLSPSLSSKLLHSDMVTVAAAIIESARHPAPKRGRGVAAPKRPAATRRQAAAVRQTTDAKRRRASAARAADQSRRPG